MPSLATLQLDSKRLNAPVERVLAEIESRSGSPWSTARNQ
jgi:hypothetical protein